MSNTIVQDLNTIKTARDNMKTALEGKGQTVTKDIRTYAEAIANIEGGGSGDVKLFDTIANMQADPDPHEGDKAIVYRSEIQSVEENSIFSSCTFPSTVTLESAITGYAYGSFRSVDPNVFDASANVSPSSFRFQGYGDEEIRIEYSSSDGIIYTRTDGGDETIDFGTDIKFEAMMEPWNDIFGQFMKIGGNHFDGLFEYVSGIHSYRLGQIKYVTIKDNKAIIDDTHNLLIFDKNIIVNLINKCVEYVKNIENISIAGGDCATILIDEDNHLIVAYSEMDDKYMRRLRFVYDSSTSKFKCFQSEDSGTTSFVEYIFDIETSEYINKIEHTFEGTLNNLGITNIFDNYYAIGYYTDSNKLQNNTVWFNENGYYNRYGNIYEYKSNKYILADTQLNATADDVYEKTFYGKNGVEQGALATNTTNNFEDVDAEAYAKIQDYYDTLEPLVLTNSNVDEEFKYKYRKAKVLPTRSDGTQFLNVDALSSVAGLFYDFSNLRTIPNLNTGHMNDFSIMLNNCQSLTHIPNIDTSNATNMSSMFGYCHNLKSIPNLNTSKVTDMSWMFIRCNNLTTIPNLDTSNVTNMSYMFSGCTNLINISNLNTTKTTKFDHMFENCQNFDFNNMSNFNTSNASSVTYMFQNCINMTDAPMIDTSNVIDIDAIYYDCYGLVNVPALNTAKARDFSYCFCDCYNLVNIPVWNTSNIVDIRNCFVNCINLSNKSLDNILSMCASATKITNSTRKKLSYINLTQDQANICKNLPNYSAFTSAGWSTGY